LQDGTLNRPSGLCRDESNQRVTALAAQSVEGQIASIRVMDQLAATRQSAQPCVTGCPGPRAVAIGAPRRYKVAPVDPCKQEYDTEEQELRDHKVDAEILLRFGGFECKTLRDLGSGQHEAEIEVERPLSMTVSRAPSNVRFGLTRTRASVGLRHSLG
jgi:hypothetical protein